MDRRNIPPFPRPKTKAKSGMLELFAQEGWDRGAIEYLAIGIEKAINRSMIMEPTLTLDRDLEKRRRAKICLDLYRIMAHDLKWGARHAADQLEVYLLKKLRGEVIDFSSRKSWHGPGNLGG